jgi:hypothetical protein
VVGALLALAPLVGGWLATLIVVLALLLAAAASGWLALRKWRAMERRLAEDER